MRTLIAIALALSLAPAYAHARVERPIRLVLVEPPGETVTADEQQQARSSALAAADFWHSLSPIPTDLTISETEVLTTGADVYHGWAWVRPYLVDQNPVVTIFVIDNSRSHALIFGDSAGEAQSWYGLVFAVLGGYPGTDGLAATLAHELGHVLYDLAHPPIPCDLDIMCSPSPVPAYHAHFVGCASLAALGAPCKHVYLSLIGVTP